MHNRTTEEIKSSKEMASYLSQRLKRIFEENDICFAYLGGSWAKEQNYWWSDVDLFLSFPDFLYLNSKEKLKILTKLHLEATDATGLEEIEIAIIENLPPHIQYNAVAEGILIYEKEIGAHNKFIEKLLPIYYDHMIWYKNLINQSKIRKIKWD